MRSVRDNHTAVIMTLHYLETGGMMVAIQASFHTNYVTVLFSIDVKFSTFHLCTL